MKSLLTIYSLKDRKSTVIKEFSAHIEAPNWLNDGKTLLYNSGGRIYIFGMDTKQSRMIDTGHCDSCNNDHLPSPDNRHLAISSGIGEERSSRVWIVPLEGGMPHMITHKAPSYLHGWSPDGSTLAYCARRDGEFDIYTMDIRGTTEVRLTDAPGLNDGPEYTPDGEYIWFNSVRSGLMQLYRMRPDGSEQTQMTFDTAYNSWFPHISPDGKNVTYVAYHARDVAPGDHPANKNIEVRLLDAEGGEPEVLFTAFGGQGTMNVHSWSPDGSCFAYVTYTL